MSSLRSAEWITQKNFGIVPAVMAKGKISRWAEEGERLRLTREALGYPKQAAFCRLVGIEPAAWNNAETGDNRIGLDNALLLCQRFGITLDWIYRGRMDLLPPEFRDKLGKLISRPRRQARNRP